MPTSSFIEIPEFCCCCCCSTILKIYYYFTSWIPVSAQRWPVHWKCSPSYPSLQFTGCCCKIVTAFSLLQSWPITGGKSLTEGGETKDLLITGWVIINIPVTGGGYIPSCIHFEGLYWSQIKSVCLFCILPFLLDKNHSLAHPLCSCKLSIRPHSNNCRPSRSFTSCSTSFQLVQPRSFHSAKTVVFHLIFGLSHLLLPCQIKVNLRNAGIVIWKIGWSRDWKVSLVVLLSHAGVLMSLS